MLAAEKSSVGGERTGVRCFQNEMPAMRRDERLFPDGEASPKEKNQIFLSFGQTLDNGVGKLLPTDLRMRGRLVRTDGKAGIQKKNALPCPFFQVAALRHRNVQVVMQLREYIDKGWRGSDAVGDGKAEAVCLAGIVVGVLSDNDRFNFVQRALVEGGKNFRAWRIDDEFLFLFDQGLFQMLKVGHIKLVLEKFEPCRI